MKEYKNLISKPIVSIYDCIQAGDCISLIIKNNWKCSYIETVYQDIHYIIDTKKIMSLENDSILIKNTSVLIPKDSMELSLSDKFSIINAKTYDINGNFLGNITDIVLDEKFYIKQIKLSNGSNIERNMLFNLSNDLVLVKVKEGKTDRYKYKPKAIPKNKDFYSNITVKTEKIANDSLKEEQQPQINQTPNNRISDSSMLLNREATKNIVSTNGELIIRQGGKITRETIKRARMFGKIYELVKYSK